MFKKQDIFVQVCWCYNIIIYIYITHTAHTQRFMYIQFFLSGGWMVCKTSENVIRQRAKSYGFTDRWKVLLYLVKQKTQDYEVSKVNHCNLAILVNHSHEHKPSTDIGHWRNNSSTCGIRYHECSLFFCFLFCCFPHHYVSNVRTYRYKDHASKPGASCSMNTVIWAYRDNVHYSSSETHV